MGYTRVAEQAGLSRATVSQLLGYGDRRLPVKIRRTSAEALLRVRPSTGWVRVDATGTRRRIQALIAIGWTLRGIAAEAGMGESYLGAVVLHETWVRRRLAQRVAETYRRLATRPQVGRVADASRARAARNGWVSPIAWDVHTIDDPAAVPEAGDQWCPRRVNAAVDPVEVEWLRSFGTSDELIADRLGVRLATLQTAMRRAAA